MWIKESDNQNTGTFTVLEYLNFTIVNEKNHAVLKILRKVKIVKAPWIPNLTL